MPSLRSKAQAIYWRRQAEMLLDPSRWPLEEIITEIKPEFLERFLEEHPSALPIVTVGATAHSYTVHIPGDFSRYPAPAHAEKRQ